MRVGACPDSAEQIVDALRSTLHVGMRDTRELLGLKDNAVSAAASLVRSCPNFRGQRNTLKFCREEYHLAS